MIIRSLINFLVIYTVFSCIGDVKYSHEFYDDNSPDSTTLHFTVGPWRVFTVVSVKCSEIESVFDVTKTDVEVADSVAGELLNAIESLDEWSEHSSYVDTRIRMVIDYPNNEDVVVCFGRTGVEYRDTIYVMEDRILNELERYIPHFSQ